MSEAPKNSFPPGPGGSTFAFLFGDRRRDPLAFFTKLARDYGDVSQLRLLNFRTLFINHPDDIEDVLVNKARKFEKGRVMKANMRLFGEGLLTSEGDFWLRQRRLAQPAFHRARVAAYGTTMRARMWVRRMPSACAASVWPRSTALNPPRTISAMYAASDRLKPSTAAVKDVLPEIEISEIAAATYYEEDEFSRGDWPYYKRGLLTRYEPHTKFARPHGHSAHRKNHLPHHRAEARRSERHR